MKKTAFLLTVLVFSFPSFAQTKEPAAVPKMPLEVHDKLADLARQGLKIQLQINQLTARYQDMLNNDQQFQELKKQADKISQEIQEEITVAQKSVDAKKWRVDMNDIGYAKIDDPTPPPPRPPAASTQPH